MVAGSIAYISINNRILKYFFTLLEKWTLIVVSVRYTTGCQLLI